MAFKLKLFKRQNDETELKAQRKIFKFSSSSVTKDGS